MDEKYITIKDYENFDIFDYYPIWNNWTRIRSIWTSKFIIKRPLKSKLWYTLVYVYENIRYILRVPKMRIVRVCRFNPGVVPFGSRKSIIALL